MGYASELKNILRPLGLYELDSGVGAAELKAEGAGLDVVGAALEEAEREGALMTASGAGLDAWEALLPFAPACSTAAERRNAIAALLRIDYASFTPEAVNDTVAGCGIRALVEETEIALTVQVSFPDVRGEPDDIDALKARLERIIPCHLGILYVFDYATWEELETAFLTWAEIVAPGYNWRQLERLGTDA